MYSQTTNYYVLKSFKELSVWLSHQPVTWLNSIISFFFRFLQIAFLKNSFVLQFYTLFHSYHVKFIKQAWSEKSRFDQLSTLICSLFLDDKILLKQPNKQTNAQSRKSHIQNGRQFHGVFTHPCPTISLAQSRMVRRKRPNPWSLH